MRILSKTINKKKANANHNEAKGYFGLASGLPGSGMEGRHHRPASNNRIFKKSIHWTGSEQE